jgi:hypothetical protein
MESQLAVIVRLGAGSLTSGEAPCLSQLPWEVDAQV